MIEVKGVSFNYPGLDTSVLDQIDLEIWPGEFLAILGRNGSGKSTLTKLLNGLLIPSAGDVLVDGMNTRDQRKLRSIRQRVGLLFSNPDNQLVASVVEEDVAFGPENLGLEPGVIRKRVDESLAAVGMQDFLKHPPHFLSGGQKQRVAIAGIYALKPAYMVLDEPTSMLDPRGRAEVIQTLIRLNREEGTAVILVTHFAEEAALADRVLILDQGRISLSGTPGEVLTQTERLLALGLEPPEVVVLADRLRNQGYDLPPVLQVNEMVNLLQKRYIKG